MNDRSTILNQIRQAGVVGAGGAGFPTYKKLDAQVDCIIANGAECEPLLQKDRETMLQCGAEMLRGLELMQRLTGASRVVIAVKRKNQDVVDVLGADAKPLGFEFYIYEDVYPAGDEYVLVFEITGRQNLPDQLRQGQRFLVYGDVYRFGAMSRHIIRHCALPPLVPVIRSNFLCALKGNPSMFD